MLGLIVMYDDDTEGCSTLPTQSPPQTMGPHLQQCQPPDTDHLIYQSLAQAMAPHLQLSQPRDMDHPSLAQATALLPRQSLPRRMDHLLSTTTQ